ncbi:hypothetical protein PJI16_06035 [Nitrospira sp. MA-1]|nr:hypothetical protein [Nitrospira sp. MA-1]HNP31431.1 hypothetical protein [Nitrospirales bacterium]
MGKKISRRTFILSALASGLLSSLGGWWIIKVPNNVDMIEGLVRKKLNYLQIEEAGLNAFAKDIAKEGYRASRKLIIISQLFIHTNLLDSMSRMNDLGDRFAKRFLLSSDFFWYGSDVTRVVKYLGFYDPYVKPCRNPFAKFN